MSHPWFQTYCFSMLDQSIFQEVVNTPKGLEYTKGQAFVTNFITDVSWLIEDGLTLKEQMVRKI